MSTQALASLRRQRLAPSAVWVFVGEPPKWLELGPDVIVVRGNASSIDWRPIVGLHVDFIEVGNQGKQFLETVEFASKANPKSVGMACECGVAGLNDRHEEVLRKLLRTIHANPV